ncbi:MAG: CopG family ribbon-helix-helix protein [Candidatus Nezhaarchaeota archaeon]|nr:CopG family ribbon-helix-helix protein [Candidatus Nezhaarchaeota archaeon]MCX8142291.1 CopG family ribbon-helix-helix protein [Candidatus Nezhaarchaeota archaeon]MDW8050736.1 CopG family ribbon-helix-helix protein [Nitrososphaerota archaeon]
MTFSIPQELEKDLNDVIKYMGFVNRSEAIRYALRLLVSEFKSLSGLIGKVLAIVAVVYKESAEKTRVCKVQHEYGDIIDAYFHAHIDGEKCVEVMVIHGEAEKVRCFLNGLRASRDLEQMRIVFLS